MNNYSFCEPFDDKRVPNIQQIASDLESVYSK